MPIPDCEPAPPPYDMLMLPVPPSIPDVDDMLIIDIDMESVIAVEGPPGTMPLWLPSTGPGPPLIVDWPESPLYVGFAMVGIIVGVDIWPFVGM